MFVSDNPKQIMIQKQVFFIAVLLMAMQLTAQEKSGDYKVGLSYGFGSEFNNTDYTFENHFYKVQLYYKLKNPKISNTKFWFSLKSILESINC